MKLAQCFIKIKKNLEKKGDVIKCKFKHAINTAL